MGYPPEEAELDKELRDLARQSYQHQVHQDPGFTKVQEEAYVWGYGRGYRVAMADAGLSPAVVLERWAAEGDRAYARLKVRLREQEPELYAQLVAEGFMQG